VVFLTGNLHVLLRFTMDQAGGIHVASHFQPQGIIGVGQTTGDKYQATGVTQDQFNAKVGVEETFINNFRIIGPGMATTSLSTKHSISQSMPMGFRQHLSIISASIADKFPSDCAANEIG
jgi:hypothetical protein